MAKQKLDDSTLPVSTRWLIRNLRDYYRRSNEQHTPGSRTNNRKKFIFTARQLLPLLGKEQTLAAFRGGVGKALQSQDEDGAAIIEQLASEPPEPAKPSTTPAAAHSATPALDLSEVNRLLAAGLEPLLRALKLLNGGEGAEVNA